MSIEARVEVLERSTRRWRVAAVGLGTALVAMVGLGAADKKASDTVSARTFAVVNAKGETVGLLSAEDEGGRLTLKSKEGGPVVSLATRADVATVSLYDGRRFGLNMAVQPGEFATVAVRDTQQGGTKASMMATARGARVSTLGGDGQSGAVIEAPPKGAASVSVKNAEGESVWSEPNRK